jgi:putative PIN family toxin of toxin-antitoxin system
MIDTNVMVSAALFPQSKVALALSRAMQSHTLVVCTYALEELQDVFQRKFPNKIGRLNAFLSNLVYELCRTPKINANTPEMRDEDDRPILQAAIDAEVDAILSGDDDFHAMNIERPRIISPSYFLNDF